MLLVFHAVRTSPISKLATGIKFPSFYFSVLEEERRGGGGLKFSTLQCPSSSPIKLKKSF